MTWFILSCAAPVLWGVTNYIDKLVLSRLSAHAGVGTMMIFSSLISIISIPLLLIFAPDIDPHMSLHTLFLCVVGILYALGLWAYFFAIARDEASIVVPFFQLMPLLTALLAFIFLGETLSTIQIIACIAVCVGALFLSLDLSVGRFRKHVVWYMFICSLCFALSNILFKALSLEQHFWNSWFWEQVGLGLFGCFLMCIPKYRRDFMHTMRRGSARFLGINGLNEVLTLIGNVFQRIASMLAPLALVAVISNAVQPVVVLVYGVLLTMFFPHILKENVTRKHVAQKMIAILIMAIGTYYLNPFM